MKISIIMPVYNGGKFLKETIESIQEQTYRDWELIIIDDCSTDNSYVIAEEMAQTDQRIKVIKNEVNLGISGNRNKGLEFATGEYVAFSDDDDLFTPGLLEDNVKILNENENIDMIKFGRRLISVDSAGKEFEDISTKMEFEGLLDEVTKYQKYFLVRKSDTLFNLWNGIYKTNMLKENNIKFDESMKYGGEDADFSYKCYLKSKYIYINPKVYYIHYKRDASSTSRKYNVNKIDSVIKAMETEFLIWEKVNFDLIDNQYYRIIALNINIDNIMFSQVFHKDSKLNYNERKQVFDKINEDTLQDRYILNKEIRKMLRKNSKKHYIISVVVSKKKYFLIDFFYKLASSFKKKKWK